VQRALVRAKVTTLRAGQTGLPADWQAARALLAWADETTRPVPARLMITHGVSGSGKTHGTQAVVECQGALRVRADVERKRLHGLGPLQRPADDAARALLYGEAANEATQARLLAAAEAVLAGGWPVVLDATHIQRRRRDAAAALARRLGVAFEILDFPASPQVLRQRLQQRAARGDDASDADGAVLDRQLSSAEPLTVAEQALCRQVSPEM
jgi:predicted kinase